MGYDTRLLLLDESIFGQCDRYFAKPHPDDELIREIASLLDSDRHDGELALAEWLFIQASTRAPSLPARNVALSLWREEEMGIAFPTDWYGAVETQLPGLRERFPGLRLPRTFEQNFCTGVYIEARRVPEVLALVETAVDRLDADHAWHFRNLRTVLRVAAERGLGYWEGTEIPVAASPRNADWLAEVNDDDDGDESDVEGSDESEDEARLQVVDSPFGPDVELPITREPDVWIVRSGARLLQFDSISFPPEVTAWRAPATHATYTPWGSDIAYLEGATGLVEHLDDGTQKLIDIPFPIGALRLVGDGVVVLPSPSARPDAVPVMLTEQSLGERAVKALPVPATPTAARCSAVIAFDDESFLLIWDGIPYRCARGSATRLAGGPLVPMDPVNAAIRTNAGTITGVFDGRLVRVMPDGAREVLGRVTDPVEIVRGDGDAVIVRERAGDVLFEVFWPSREVTHVPRCAFELEDEPRFCYYADIDGVLVVVTARTLHALPWERIAAMPRASL